MEKTINRKVTLTIGEIALMFDEEEGILSKFKDTSFLSIEEWLNEKDLLNKGAKEKTREIANEIVEKFEELLAEKNIPIPNNDREGKDEEAYLYGSDYYRLEDEVASILERVNSWESFEDKD